MDTANYNIIRRVVTIYNSEYLHPYPMFNYLL